MGQLLKYFRRVIPWDVVEALTDSKDPKDYIKKMGKRDPELSKGWGHIVTHLSVKQWMAQVASQRSDLESPCGMCSGY